MEQKIEAAMMKATQRRGAVIRERQQTTLDSYHLRIAIVALRGIPLEYCNPRPSLSSITSITR